MNPFVRNVDASPKLLLPALAGFYQRGEPLAYASLRACLGIVMLSHGLPKLLRTSHGSMADPMAASIRLIETVLHLPFPEVFALLVALLEGVGGVLLALGLGTRALAAAMAVQMAAIAYILGPNWPWIDRGIEYPVLMLVLFLYIVFRGGGRYSLDRLFERER
ncbi:DoxX family protein [Pseudomonas putida CSV86]|uniref:DoxX family protein n=1 Tax=Pseudomonas bharatica CSV86 TaxID=1005395 RepID=L1LU99_9PSED|nr:DoxX family protein [Pseudomonas bharatica]NNJ15817.1 DoxX family protein [Pseudomonas bharatica CSV86]